MVLLLSEKWPNCGLNWRDKEGKIKLELELESERLAEKTRGELCGEPKRPNPDLRERERGEMAVVVDGV